MVRNIDYMAGLSGYVGRTVLHDMTDCLVVPILCNIHHSTHPDNNPDTCPDSLFRPDSLYLV
jgi:hypothetical protein